MFFIVNYISDVENSSELVFGKHHSKTLTT